MLFEAGSVIGSILFVSEFVISVGSEGRGPLVWFE